jgi:hypothetical protein
VHSEVHVVGGEVAVVDAFLCWKILGESLVNRHAMAKSRLRIGFTSEVGEQDAEIMVAPGQ